jgi:hypothetical protein
MDNLKLNILFLINTSDIDWSKPQWGYKPVQEWQR